MGAGFFRRFDQDPGLATLLEIEGVDVIDRESPQSLQGLGAGNACCVGEFEDGPFEPYEVVNGQDLLQTFGAFGFLHDGLASSNPCARARRADSAASPEYWNGNGYLALFAKRFTRLFVARVDTSVGVERFTRLPTLVGNDLTTWDLEPAQTLVVRKSVSDSDTATFNAAVATRTSNAGTYPAVLVGGETLVLAIDAGTTSALSVTVVFQSSDTTQAAIISRINTACGYTAAANAGGGVTTLVSRLRGTAASLRIVSLSAAIATATGFSAGVSAGTGNVANIDAVTLAEVKAVVEAAVDLVRVDRNGSGALRIAGTSSLELVLLPTSTATAFGFTLGLTARQPDGVAFLYSGAGSYPTGFAGGETLTIGFDDRPDVTVVFDNADESQAEVIARINLVVGYTCVSSASSTVLKFVGQDNGGEIRIVAASSTVLTALGLSVATTPAVAQIDSVIPAGSRVTDGTTTWVTMQSWAVTAGEDGPYDLKVRPALDDGSAAGASSGTVTTLLDDVVGAAYSVTNVSAISAALSESAIDALYSAALDQTLSTRAVTRETTVIFSARQSNAVRSLLRTNAISASRNLRGRVAVIAPPLGTTRAVARSAFASPGVGATRNQDVTYAYPGLSVYVPAIAARGTAGGAGFSSDGIVDVHGDSLEASLMTLLPPEQNIGQVTSFTSGFAGLERGNADILTMDVDDYIAFKRAGIAAWRVDNGVLIVQSDVTSVDPQVSPQNAPGNRRRFSFYAQDSLAQIVNGFTKKPMTRSNRTQCYGSTVGFLELLRNDADPDNARIDSFSVDAKNVNTPAVMAMGLYRQKIKIRMNPDFLAIVLDTEVGPNVVPSVNIAE